MNKSLLDAEKQEFRSAHNKRKRTEYERTRTAERTQETDTKSREVVRAKNSLAAFGRLKHATSQKLNLKRERNEHDYHSNTRLHSTEQRLGTRQENSNRSCAEPTSTAAHNSERFRYRFTHNSDQKTAEKASETIRRAISAASAAERKTAEFRTKTNT